MPVRFGISDGHCQRGFRRLLNVIRIQTTQGILFPALGDAEAGEALREEEICSALRSPCGVSTGSVAIGFPSTTRLQC